MANAAPPRSADRVPSRDRIEGLLALDGAAGKTPFVAAVETTPEGKPVRLKLRRVAGFRSAAITAFAKQSLDPSSNVVSDGLAFASTAGTTSGP